MERMEMADKLREHASISIEEARDILARNNWDILDAMVELERAGKTKGGVEASDRNPEPEYVTVSRTLSREEEKARRKEQHEAFRGKVKKFIRTLLDNKFIVQNKYGERIICVPVLALIIFAIAVTWLAAVLFVAGLIFGFRFSFEGKEFGRQSVNDGLEKAGTYTQELVRSITEKCSGEHKEDQT